MAQALSRLSEHFNLRLAVPVTLSVFIFLVAGKLVLRVPGRLLLVIGSVFLILTVTLAWVAARKERQITPADSIRWIAILVLTSIVTLGLLLGAVYRIDDAGWLWFQLTGYDVTLAEDYPDRVDLPIAAFVEQNPFFDIDPQNAARLVLKKGVYDVDDTIIVPRGTTLIIEPGTVLRFGAGRSLISYSPIIARGTDIAPILFTAQNDWLKWGVVGVVEADPSVFEHVRFTDGRQASVNGIDFFGALSLIESDVRIIGSQFTDLFGKDGVYIRQGHVFMQDNLISNVYKDGLDLDSGTGQVSNNKFIDCGDEGIDLGENYDV
ncbi:MAG: right-handed parallel beta-helix repeat-containing protein, partial [Candidatus Promineifilaceae bacterium]